MFVEHKWICSICQQGFTRKSSTREHNNNLHSGQATIVRPMEYMIKRVKNEFGRPIDSLLSDGIIKIPYSRTTPKELEELTKLLRKNYISDDAERILYVVRIQCFFDYDTLLD